MKAPFGLKPRLSSMGVVGGAHPAFLGKQCALREARRMAAVRCHSHQNGTAEHGRTTTKTRTMFVADLDMSQDGDVPSTSSRTVTVPANGVVARGSKLGSDSVNGGLVRQSDAQLVKDNRALKEELLKAKADLAVQAHDVQELRSKLAERDRSLQLTKSELIETRISLQEKEVLLQEAYDRLRKATNERAEFRRYLMEAEQELRTTRAELLEWSQGLLDLKNVMEGLDDDLSELVGTSTYAAAMLEIEDNLQHANGSSQSNGFKDLGRMSLDESLSDDEMDDITEALRDLQKLSQQILEEAKEDTAYFK